MVTVKESLQRQGRGLLEQLEAAIRATQQVVAPPSLQPEPAG
jgi:hypothetical protein